MATHDLDALLAGRGYRSTRPRQAVWDALQDGAHRTAEEVARTVHQVHPEVNLASIYRALALLRDLGLVRESRLAGGDQASRWELAHPDEHFHVVCDRCGRVDHHVGSLVAAITEHLSASHRFVPERVELVVHGHCVSCDQSDSHEHSDSHQHSDSHEHSVSCDADHGHDGGEPWIANPSHH